MAVALFLATETGTKPMTRSKTLIALALLASTVSTVAQAADWTNSSNYNGYGAYNQNSASNYSLRDQNGNLTMVDGRVTSAQYSQGTGGAMNAYGQATAIGNQLSVTVIGSRNTTIIDSTQINNGNQTATADLNTH
jgi:holdfast attachment protein HfaA